MFGLRFFKAQPSEYIIRYTGGRVAGAGPGIAFFYLEFNTQIVAVQTSSQDAGFVFNESTRNFQAVTLQGQFTYRIADPQKAAAMLNFTLDPRKRVYVSNDPERLPQRLTNIVQRETRAAIEDRTLEDTLRQFEAIAPAVLTRVRESGALAPLGVELLGLFFISAQPTPEVGKALEAQYRETLLRQADEAIYARRAAAVDEERKIKENELNSQISLEQQREHLIALQGKNAEQEADYRGKAIQKEAEYRAKATESELAAYRGQDPRTVLAVGLRELGANADKIGNLTITSEILAALLNAKAPGSE